MIIEKIRIKNFKSYGNNMQDINLNQNYGELILLQGSNGSGKSSISDSIDYCLFNKVKGKKKKSVVLSTLPNRLNNNLSVQLYFKVNNVNYDVERSMNPGKLKLNIDGTPYNRTGSKNINAKIEEVIDIDLDTFKSFISMSINDFKNFMTLSPDEKRRLLDKLFNLGMLNELSKILKNIKTNNQKELILYNDKIIMYQQNINSVQITIDKIKESKKHSLEQEVITTKEEILSNKEIFINIQIKINKIKDKTLHLKNYLFEDEAKLKDLEFQIRDFNRQLTLYNKDMCSECGSPLTTDYHIEKKEILKEKLKQTKEIYKEIEIKIKQIKEKQTKLKSISDTTNNQFFELKSHLNQLKSKLLNLKAKEAEQLHSGEIIELIKNVELNVEQLNHSSVEKDSRFVKQNILKKLDELFSEDGIKKSIIRNIIKPINSYIAENLKLLDIPFNVELNEHFDANVTLLGNEIDVESLSTGETKKVNISIMLAYLKMIRMKRNINILFLDEIFSSIDIEGINSIIHILKKFAREWSVNVFLVHHSQLDKILFDRILHIEKNITSNIKEEIIKNETEILHEIEEYNAIED